MAQSQTENIMDNSSNNFLTNTSVGALDRDGLENLEEPVWKRELSETINKKHVVDEMCAR